MSSVLTASFQRDVLAPLVARNAAGEDEQLVRDELLHAVLPWVRRQIAAQVRRLPPTADPCGVSSMMHEAAYLAVRRIDWAKWEQWPVYLATLVRRSAQEAARSDDYLSRHQRVLRTRFRAACIDRERAVGRPLCSSDRMEVALSVAGGRADLAEFLLLGLHPREVADPPDHVIEVDSLEDDVERTMTRASVRRWLEDELPQTTRQMVLDWLETPRSQTLPRRLEHHLRPYVASLLRAVDDQQLAGTG